ncbi:MAG: hypothetical protein AMXMBFR64_31500 [Myxococcales bacterium]
MVATDPQITNRPACPVDTTTQSPTLVQWLTLSALAKPLEAAPAAAIDRPPVPRL